MKTRRAGVVEVTTTTTYRRRRRRRAVPPLCSAAVVAAAAAAASVAAAAAAAVRLRSATLSLTATASCARAQRRAAAAIAISPPEPRRCAAPNRLRAQNDAVMKRGMEKWSQLEDSLIDHVRSHPILYSRNAKSYKHMLIKENQWKDIAANLGISRRDCKLKWKGIRDGFRRNKILENNGKANRKSKYSDDRLKFLANTTKKKDGDFIKQENSDEEEDFQEYADNPVQDEKQLPPSLFPPHPAPVAPEPQLEQMSAMSYDKEILLEELRKGREERYELIRLLSAVTMQQGAVESITHSFFKSMADVVSQFPPHRIADVRMRVCNLVSETEIQVMSEASPAEQVEVSLTTDCARTHKKTEFRGPEIPLFDVIRR